ncbi:class I SAM-dependent methyltransferase [Candidatus Aquiluna sp. UB-MaderosW2red]|jgi:16S rRNA G1207 methylase RsmC|uniref:class I SAM-dependent methyltransferase n=1 Tax=Candidatus Aquiluna sp. UB-MaderosW2red TaxID=1855377 RepID=UPI000875B64D|nr:methyltransferase [Candidatus Aquiluna sp. UB-MaderosW2red]SCX13289.1 Methyltransferase small domain-containing protein [Candidatus Aquiluna sp. UB-MaderosW2red]
MVAQHYFSSDPQSSKRTSDVEFEVGGVEFSLTAASGTFSATKLDPGTRVLLKEHRHFPKSGNVLDLGCGWGPISIAIAKLNPNTVVYALDVNNRSLELTMENAKRSDVENINPVLALDVPDDLEFQAIWSNPPIRIGKQALHELLQAWLPRLAIDGVAMLVVQKQLGADSLQQWIADSFENFSVERVNTAKGYRIIRALRTR